MNDRIYTELLHQSLVKHRSRNCFCIKRDGKYITRTYDDFHADLNRLTTRLKSTGFGQGQNSIIIGENTPEWVTAYFGIVLSGGCAVPVDPNLPPAEITEIIRCVKPTIVFCSTLFKDFFLTLDKDLRTFKSLVLLPGVCSLNDPAAFDDFIKTEEADKEAFSHSFNPDDPVAILFTSGTTGNPKGVLILQRNLAPASVYGTPRMKVNEHTRVMALLPLHHVFGFAACVSVPLAAGMEILFMPVIKGPLIVEGLCDRKISFLPAVPQMLELFFNNIERKVADKGLIVRLIFSFLRLLSRALGPVLGMRFKRRLFKSVHDGFGGSLELVISGGSSLKKKYFRGYREMGFNIMEGYGLTETFGPITVCPVDDPRLGSVGTVLQTNEMRILNPDREGRGEVLFRGDTVFGGYYRNPDATAAAFDREGYFHTGDLGYVTRDGFLYLTGRIKDIIVLPSGKNVYPEELEAFYSKSVLIEEIAVCGINTGEGEAAVAFVVPNRDIRRRSSPEDAHSLIQADLKRMDRALPSYKKISDLRILYTPLPRTSTQKVKKAELLKQFSAPSANPENFVRLTLAEEALTKTEEYRTLVKFILQGMEKAPSAPLSPRSTLEVDLRMDSLRKLDLIAALERAYSIEIPAEGPQKLDTLKDVVQWIIETKSRTSVPQADRPQTTRPSASFADNQSPWLLAAPSAIRRLSKLLYRLKISGLDKIPGDRPVIFCANHASYLDAVWILGALPWMIRKKTFALGKIELLRLPVLGRVLRQCNLLAVEREGDVSTALSAAEDLLRQNKNLLIFPEGTRTLTGELGPFRSGVGLLMQKTGAVAVPILIQGSFRIWPSGKKPHILFSRHLNASLTFGNPLYPAFTLEQSETERAALLTEKIKTEIRLLQDAQQCKTISPGNKIG